MLYAAIHEGFPSVPGNIDAGFTDGGINSTLGR